MLNFRCNQRSDSMETDKNINLEKPGISIVLPLKNAGIYIDQLLLQINVNVSDKDEVIIIDDYSEDTTLYKLKDWQRKNKGFRVLKNKNKGFINALNFGVAEASNEWIARWDQDDLYSNIRLETQREYLKRGTVAVFSDFSFISSKEKILGSMQTAITSDATKLSIVGAHRTAHPAAIFSKSAFYDVGGYRDKDFLAEDISLWLRLSRLGNFVSIPDILLNYRVHPGSLSGKNQKLSQAKKHKVLNEIRLQQEVITNITQEWREIFETYDLYSYAVRRKILLLHDLINIRRYNYIVIHFC